MRPAFGCAIHDLVFAPNDETTWGLARYAVEEALGWWEPRIDVVDIRVRPHPDVPNRVDIHVEYRVRATKDARTLVAVLRLRRRMMPAARISTPHLPGSVDKRT
jgi:phage baseplate assembly protein W